MNRYLFENDYSADSLRWIKQVEEKQLLHDNYQELEKLQNEIIENQDSASAYFFAYEYEYKPYRMQQVVIDGKDPKYSYLFAQNIKNADIKALQKIVINSGKPKYICKFACFVRGADLKLLEGPIIKSKNVKYAHMFIKHAENINMIN